MVPRLTRVYQPFNALTTQGLVQGLGRVAHPQVHLLLVSMLPVLGRIHPINAASAAPYIQFTAVGM
jgi:hypothetical protein